MKLTHCPRCGAPLPRWATLDSTLIPYEPHPRGHLTLQADVLVRIRDITPPSMSGWKKNDLSKFGASAFAGERLESHYAVCPRS